MSDVIDIFAEWEKKLRDVIRDQELKGNLGAVEVAKALLLHGIHMYEGYIRENIPYERMVLLVQEMKRRTDVVLEFCKKRYSTFDK